MILSIGGDSDRSVPDKDLSSSKAISRLIRSRSSRKNSARAGALLEALGGEPASVSGRVSIRVRSPWVNFLRSGPTGLALLVENTLAPATWLALRMKG